ncbi:nucleotide exchange factor GrpE [Candidatus Marsarchaeota archaeon]|nr:nucleotide exchange factor GrpE [Candidatus Marsarchaeota archaeon]
MPEERNEKEEKKENSAKTGGEQQKENKKEEQVSKKEYDELKERMLRLAAEFDNYKRRSAADVANAKNVGKAEMLKRLMPVMDEFELAMISSTKSSDENLARGVKMVYANLMGALKAEGMEEVDTKGKYDPYRSEIVMVRETDKSEPGEVLEVLKKGYAINGILVRPASVIIAKEPSEMEERKSNEEKNDEKENNGKQ